MSKRPLTDVEKKIIEKNVQTLKDDLEYQEKVLLPQKQFTLDTAEIVFKKQIKEVETEKKRIENTIKEIKSIIEATERQVKEGVDIKEINEVSNSTKLKKK